MFKHIEHRYVIYLLVAVVVALPMLKPVGLPIDISGGVRQSYDFIESLPDGITVLMIFDATPTVFMDVGATGTAFLEQAFRKNMNVINVCFKTEAIECFPKALAALGRKDLVYGADYVDLGLIPGEETGQAALAMGIHAVSPLDRYGKKLSEIPLTANVRSVGDIGLVLSMSGGNPGTESVVRQIGSRFPVPIVSGCTSGDATKIWVLRDSGLVKGVVPGIKGGAEYEQLIQRPGYGTSSMDSMSGISLYVVGLLVVGNVMYFRSKAR